MSKALTLVGMVIAILLVLLFGLDLALPQFLFGRVSVIMDGGFIVCGILLGLLSWTTYREQ